MQDGNNLFIHASRAYRASRRAPSPAPASSPSRSKS
jgi:hypothetical protein